MIGSEIVNNTVCWPSTLANQSMKTLMKVAYKRSKCCIANKACPIDSQCHRPPDSSFDQTLIWLRVMLSIWQWSCFSVLTPWSVWCHWAPQNQLRFRVYKPDVMIPSVNHEDVSTYHNQVPKIRLCDQAQHCNWGQMKPEVALIACQSLGMNLKTDLSPE